MIEPSILSAQDIKKLRAETKGTLNKIHFNNAGASFPPDSVVESVINYLAEEASNGGYEVEYKYREELENTYHQIARLINAHVNEIAVVENASTAWGLAFHGISFREGDEVIISEMEYVTSLMGFLHAKKTIGIKIKVIPNDSNGNFSMPLLEAAISPKTKLIAITHISSTAGNILPVVEIGKIARKHNILYLVDACQSAGQLPVDVKKIGCDMLSVTGRKYLRAPRGTGFLFVKKEIQNDLNLFFMDGHTAEWVSTTDYKIRDDARRFELYEKNRALTLGLGKAISYALDIGVDRIWLRIQLLADLMRGKLEEINGITVHDTGNEKCGIVTFSVKSIDARSVKSRLFQNGVNVSVGQAISTLIYMNKNHLQSVIRASVHYFNTEEEISTFCTMLSEMVR